MRLNIKAIGFSITPSIKNYAESRILSLDKFIKRFEKGGKIMVLIELIRTTYHHRKGIVYKAVADIRLPKKVLEASAEDIDLRAAVDSMKNKLKAEIEKYKSKYIEAEHRGSGITRSGTSRK
jgi:ribosomal subunit interface protein